MLLFPPWALIQEGKKALQSSLLLQETKVKDQSASGTAGEMYLSPLGGKSAYQRGNMDGFAADRVNAPRDSVCCAG